MQYIRKISDFLDKICLGLIMILLIVMSVSLTLLIFGRNIFGVSFASVEEVSRYTLIWLTFIGAAVGYKRQEHMSFDYILVHFLSKGVRRVVLIIKELIILFLVGCMAYYGKDLVVLNFNEVSLQAMIPMGYVYMVIPVSGLIMVIHNIVLIYSHIRPEVQLSSDEDKVMIGG